MLEPIEYRKTMSRLKRQVLDPSSKSMLRTLYYPLGIKNRSHKSKYAEKGIWSSGDDASSFLQGRKLRKNR